MQKLSDPTGLNNSHLGDNILLIQKDENQLSAWYHGLISIISLKDYPQVLPSWKTNFNFDG